MVILTMNMGVLLCQAKIDGGRRILSGVHAPCQATADDWSSRPREVVLRWGSAVKSANLGAL